MIGQLQYPPHLAARWWKNSNHCAYGDRGHMFLQIDESYQQPMLFPLIEYSHLNDAVGFCLETIGPWQ